MNTHSEIARLQQELADRKGELGLVNEKLERLLELKNRFLSLASHDIRTPISTMKLAVEVLENQLQDDPRPGLDRLLSILSRSIARVERRIEEMLMIARLDISGIKLEVGPLDLNSVVKEAIASFFPSAISRDVNLDASFDDIPPMRGDAQRIHQLTSVLIGAVLEGMDPGLRLTVATRAESEGAGIEVRGNGPPLPEERARALMAGLEEENPSDLTRASLYTAHQIARRHGGRLEIKGGEEGPTFFVWLPLEAQQEKEA